MSFNAIPVCIEKEAVSKNRVRQDYTKFFTAEDAFAIRLALKNVLKHFYGGQNDG